MLLFSGTGSGDLDSLVDRMVGDGGTYFARITGDGEYNFVVTRGATFDVQPEDFNAHAEEAPPLFPGSEPLESNDGTAQDITDVTAVFGTVISLGIAGAEPDDAAFETVLDHWYNAVVLSNNVTGGSVYSYDGSYFGAPTGNAVFARDPEALGYFWRQGADELRADFSIPQQTVSIDVGSDDPSDSAWLRAFDENGFLIGEVFSGSVARGESETLTITRPVADIAYIVSAGIDGEVVPLDNLVFDINLFDEDLYSVDVLSGEILNFSAYIPGAGPNLFQNRLYDANVSHLTIELIDPFGNSIAVDNWNIEHTAAVSGTYQVRVFADNSAGEYVLIRDIPNGGNRPTGNDGRSFGLDADQAFAAAVVDDDEVNSRNGTSANDIDNGKSPFDSVPNMVRNAGAIEISAEGRSDFLTPRPDPYGTPTSFASVFDAQLPINLDRNQSSIRRIYYSGNILDEISRRAFNDVEVQFVSSNKISACSVCQSIELGTNGSPDLTFEKIPFASGMLANAELEKNFAVRSQRFQTSSVQLEPDVLFDIKTLLDLSDEFLFEFQET